MSAGASPRTFTNPIVPAVRPEGSADPSVVFWNGHYYYCKSLRDSAIGVARARRLQDIGAAPMAVVWRAVPGTTHAAQVWAPELQRVRGRWTIYFAASDGDNARHRMHVLVAQSADPQGAYAFKGQLATPGDAFAIDGVALEHRGRLYFVWSGWRTPAQTFPQVLYIAAMRNPWAVTGQRHEIAAPTEPWEQVGAPLIEGPAVLRRGGRLHIAYSASGSWTDDYALGLLTLAGRDVLRADAWVKQRAPVFARHPAGSVHGPGHNAFVTSPDGTEDWIVYHAIDSAGGGWPQRSVRAQRLGWRAGGVPDFGVPVAAGVALAEPSGTLPSLRPGQHRPPRPAAAHRVVH